MMPKKYDDYFEFHESPQELYDDPADYQEAIGNTATAKQIRAKRKAVENGDIPEPELFTDDEWAFLKRVALETWHYVAQDLLISDYSREQVFELVFDAGRIKEQTNNENELAIVTKFIDLGWDEMLTYIKDIFPVESYE